MWQKSNTLSLDSLRWDETLSTLTEMSPVISHLGRVLTSLGYQEEDRFNIRLALEEAVTNAIHHGHRCDPARQVRLAFSVSPRQVLIRVQDEGPGFDPDQLSDPLDPANLDRPCGRGVFLMHATMTRVRYNARGNCVTLCKKRAS
jgi:serine/threonine-protein kinase RsbW